MYQKILYPTDFSDGAQQVIIVRIINEKKAECISQGVAWAGMEVGDFLKQTYQMLLDEASEQIKSVEMELKSAGFDTKIVIERGDPYSKILELADKEDVSVIILGSHGRSNLSKVLLGSVSVHIISHARQPVLVIKRDS